MSSTELEHVQNVWSQIKPNSPIYQLLLNDIVITSASRGVVQAHLQVLPIHLNSKGSLHGSVSACLVDWAGSMAVASHGRDKTGVSTDIHVSYVAGAKEGDWLHVEGEAIKVGGTLAFTKVTISKLDSDMNVKGVVVTATHTKYVKQ